MILSFNGIELLLANGINVCYIGYGNSLSLINTLFPQVKTIDIGSHNLLMTFKTVCCNLPHELNAFIDLQKNSRSIILQILLFLKYKMPVYTWNKRSINKNLIVLLNRLTGRWLTFNIVRNYNQPKVGFLMFDCIKRCLVELTEGKINTPAVAKGNKCPVSSGKRTLIIAPGGSRPVKHIPPEIIVSIVKKLKFDCVKPFKIYLTGDANNNSLCKKIKLAIEVIVEIENVTGLLDWKNELLLLSQANVMLATDSSMMHLANYLGIPCVTLLGPTVEGFGYVEATEKNIIFFHTINCRPCSKNGNIPCTFKDNKCYYNINPAIISDALKQYLL